MTRENLLTESQVKVINEKMEETMQVLSMNRKTIEESVMALPDVAEDGSNNSNRITSGITAIFMVIMNVMIVLKHL